MNVLDPEIRDQAYQFFTQESLEFLQILEEGLLNLRQDHSVPKVHDLMRAAHSIKGGAAIVGLTSIQLLAHQLEDVLRSLYKPELEIDLTLEEMLLRAYDCLRSPLVQQIETGRHDEEAALLNAEPVFAQLTDRLGPVDSDELPSSTELGIDIIQVIFSGDVSDGLIRLQRVLANPASEEVAGEICAQADVFVGVGELTNLKGFVAIAKATISAVRSHPKQAEMIGQLALADFQMAQAAVLGGDRTLGGCPSAELLEWVKQEERWVYEIDQVNDNYPGGELDLAFESLGQLLEDEIGDGLFPEAELGIELGTELGTELRVAIEKAMPIPVMEAPGLESSEALDLEASTLDLPFSISDIPASTIQVEPEMVKGDNAENNAFQDLEELFGSVDQGDRPISTEPPEPSAHRYIDQYIRGNQSLVTRLAHRLQDSNPQTAPTLSNTIRVDLDRLERLNNLVGELVTQENGSILQNQQFQTMLGALLKRFSRFEQITRDLQDILDRSQSDRARLDAPAQSDNSSGFDALQMDSYSGAHLLMQETVEEIAQLGETMRDMTMLTQQGNQTQRKKQQTLKQVRNDLLWARMLPLGDLLQRFPRMVRDMSAKHEKQVVLKLNGASTLVDKAVLEKLFDPLVHLVRNAFDHGIERPEERLKHGKPEQGTIEIRASHRGNQTYIEVRDDGQGIDVEAIRKKAIALRLVSAEEATTLSSDRLYDFIFAPGFSTAAKVSELSGRGVGMDAVRSQIKRLKGDISLRSEPGKGTVFTLRLPLTLSIAKLLVFTVDSSTLALPIDTLISILTIPTNQIQTLQGNQFYRWQDRLIPLYPRAAFLQHYPLAKVLGTPVQAMPLPKKGKVPILVISSGSQAIALQVDQIIQEQELVIKPFGSALVPPPYLTGCTILGDGSLVPVLDGSALLERKQFSETMVLVDSEMAVSEIAPRIAPQPTPQTSINGGLPNLSKSPTMGDLGGGLPESLDYSQNPFHSLLLHSAPTVPTILIIDDSLTARQTLAFTLEKAGHRVIQAKDGREALVQLHQTPVQAVFCDVEMPVMNGFEFLEQCRKEYPKALLPVVMLTSRSGDKHRQMADYLGATAYLTKPFLEQELLRTLQAHLIQA